MITIYFSLDENGYLDGWGSTSSKTETEIELEIDRNHVFFDSDSCAFKYIDGELVEDKARRQRLIEEHEKEESKLSKEDINSIAIMELAQLIMMGGN